MQRGGGSAGGRCRNRAAQQAAVINTESGRPLLQAAVTRSGRPLQAAVTIIMFWDRMPQQNAPNYKMPLIELSLKFLT